MINLRGAQVEFPYQLRWYGAQPLRFEPSRSYTQSALDQFRGKPFGFWFSVEDGWGWYEWNLMEEFASTRFTSTVEISPNCRVLLLATEYEIWEFTRLYGVERGSEFERKMIDWTRVCAEYDGVVIAPFQSEAHFVHLWYYGWDCSSGVVWNLSALSVQPPQLTSEVRGD